VAPLTGPRRNPVEIWTVAEQCIGRLQGVVGFGDSWAALPGPSPTTVNLPLMDATRAGHEHDGEVGSRIVRLFDQRHQPLIVHGAALDVGCLGQAVRRDQGAANLGQIAADLHDDGRIVLPKAADQFVLVQCAGTTVSTSSPCAIGRPAADQQPDMAVTPGMTSVG